MIPFLIVTSILNIALGYALAVYLGQAIAPATASDWSATPTSMIDTISSVAPYSAPLNTPLGATDAASSLLASGKMAPQSADAAARLHADAHDEEPPFVRSEVMEQELLAGIEEFRNQLSQLKGQGVSGVFLTR